MSTVTFDKLAYLETLKASGVPEDQARAHTAALDAALHDSFVTEAVLTREIQPIKTEIYALKTDVAVLKWMMGVLLAGVAFLVIKSFFG
jgi:hypothetical protein